MKIKYYNLRKETNVFENDSGWLAAIVNGEFPKGNQIKNIHIGDINPGKIRGNHKHSKMKEWLIIAGGNVIFAWRDEDGVGQKELSKNDFLLFELEPGVTHAIKNIDEKPLFWVAITNSVHDKDNIDNEFDQILK